MSCRSFREECTTRMDQSGLSILVRGREIGRLTDHQETMTKEILGNPFGRPAVPVLLQIAFEADYLSSCFGSSCGVC